MFNDMITVQGKNHGRTIHWHDELEIDLILTGELEVMSNQHMYKLVPGEIIVMNRGDAHALKRHTDDLRYVQIRLNLTDFDYFIPKVSEACFYCTPEGNDPLSEKLKEMIRSAMANLISYAESPEITTNPDGKIIYCCIEILGILKRFFSTPEDRRIENSTNINPENAWKVVGYLQENIGKTITLKGTAEATGMDPAEIERNIDSRLGMTFETFLEAVRVALSVWSLALTEKSIVEIAQEEGFHSIDQYRIAFAQTFGITPDEYRKRGRRLLQEKKYSDTDRIAFDENEKRSEILTLLKKHETVLQNQESRVKNVVIDIRAFGKSPAGSAAGGGPAVLKNEPVGFDGASRNSVWNFNMRSSLADIEPPYISPEEGIYAWQDEDAVKIILARGNDASFSEIVLKIDGLDPYGEYVFCRRRSPDIPVSLRELAFSDKAALLNEDIRCTIQEMACEYGEFSGEPHVHMVVPLKEEQLEKIIIQQL